MDDAKPPGAEGKVPNESSITVRKDPTGSNRIIIDFEGDTESPRTNPPPTILNRWEAFASVIIFALSSAVQFDVIPQGRHSKLAMWAISVIAQVGYIFGRPLLVRGIRQPIESEKK